LKTFLEKPSDYHLPQGYPIEGHKVLLERRRHMKQKLVVSVSKKPKEDGLASCKPIGLREKIIRFFLGKKEDIMVFIPSNRIDEVVVQNKKGE